eukprot:XP_014771755.1 PREDICTED: acylglycerol kinase, mitochondrial-like [Octopus bimaculoides]
MVQKITNICKPTGMNMLIIRLARNEVCSILLTLKIYPDDCIYTEYEGQVKQLLTVLEKEHTDAIVVAGGDGTLLETVTGMMRKSNNQKFCQAVPVGVIPLGQQNRFATLLFGEDPNQVK